MGVAAYLPIILKIPIVEWNLLFTRVGEARGFHYHKEFDEYVLIASGHGTYVERHEDGHETFFKVAAGDCLHFLPALRTLCTPSQTFGWSLCCSKRWDDCAEPITRIET